MELSLSHDLRTMRKRPLSTRQNRSRKCAAALLFNEGNLPEWQTELISLTQSLSRSQIRDTMTTIVDTDNANQGAENGAQTCLCSDLNQKLRILSSIIEGLSGTLASLEEKEKQSTIEVDSLEVRLCQLEVDISKLGRHS